MREEPQRLGHFLFALPLDVPAYLSLVQPDGRGEVSDAPDAVLFQIQLPDVFELLSQVQARFGFQGTDGIRHRDVGRDLDLEMNMVGVSIGRTQDERRILLDGLPETVQQFDLGIVFQDLPSPPCAPDDMVLVLVG